MLRNGELCPVCGHPDLQAIDILLFQGYTPDAVRTTLNAIGDLPTNAQIKWHLVLGHPKMDKRAVISVLTRVLQRCHKTFQDADKLKVNEWRSLNAYRSRLTTAMKMELKAVELMARIEHLITDNREVDSNAIEEAFEADDSLLDRIIENRLAHRGQRIVNITPAPSALARVSPPIEDAETVAPEATANGAHD